MNKSATALLKKIAKKNQGKSFANVLDVINNQKGQKELSIKAAPIRSANITYEDLQNEIRELAYKKWEEAGYPIGDGRDFWNAAEQELFGPEVKGEEGYYVYIQENDNIEYKLICNGVR